MRPVSGVQGVAGDRGRELLGVVAVGAVALAGTAVLATVDPHDPGHYPVCPTLALTGLYCAGCGSLRAVHDLTRLDLASAWDMNPLLVLAAPLLVAAWLVWLWRAWTGRQRRGLAPAWVVWSFFFVVVAYSVVRNVPALAPWLAP